MVNAECDSSLRILRAAATHFSLLRRFVVLLYEASELTYAVSSIASRRLLQRVLKVCKQSVGELLGCIRAVNSLKIADDDFGKSRHTASSEPFFYDQVLNTPPLLLLTTLLDV